MELDLKTVAEKAKEGKFPVFARKLKNRKIGVLVADNIFEFSMKIVDGDNEARSLNKPIRNIGSETIFKLSRDGAIALHEALTDSLNFYFKNQQFKDNESTPK